MSVRVDIDQLINFIDPEFRLRRQRHVAYRFSNNREFIEIGNDPYGGYDLNSPLTWGDEVLMGDPSYTFAGTP